LLTIGLLLGTALAALLIHFLNLSVFRRVVFTNVQFLANLSRKPAAISRLQNWLILLCRILLLLSLAWLVFSSLKGRVGSKEVTVLLDNSLSMQNQENGVSYRAKAKTIAADMGLRAQTRFLYNGANTNSGYDNNEFGPNNGQVEERNVSRQSLARLLKEGSMGGDIVAITDGQDTAFTHAIAKAGGKTLTLRRADRLSMYVDTVVLSSAAQPMLTIRIISFEVTKNPIEISLSGPDLKANGRVESGKQGAITYSFPLGKPLLPGAYTISLNPVDGAIYDLNARYFFSVLPKVKVAYYSNESVSALKGSLRAALNPAYFRPEPVEASTLVLLDLDFPLPTRPIGLRSRVVIVPGKKSTPAENVARINTFLAQNGSLGAVQVLEDSITKNGISETLDASLSSKGYFERVFEGSSFVPDNIVFKPMLELAKGFADPVLKTNFNRPALLVLPTPGSGKVYLFTTPFTSSNTQLTESEIFVATVLTAAPEVSQTGVPLALRSGAEVSLATTGVDTRTGISTLQVRNTGIKGSDTKVTLDKGQQVVDLSRMGIGHLEITQPNGPTIVLGVNPSKGEMNYPPLEAGAASLGSNEISGTKLPYVIWFVIALSALVEALALFGLLNKWMGEKQRVEPVVN
jgi:hypothetical protein